MSELDLIAGCKRGSKEAQQAFYTTFLPYLLTIARRYGIPSREEADAVQEIFIEIFSHVQRFRAKQGSVKTWVRTIAVRKILNLKRARLKQILVTGLDTAAAHSVAAIDYQQHEPRYILQAIAQLPEGYRLVFNLYEVDGYSHTEIAAMLNISEAGSRSQLSRARAALRKVLVNVTDYGAAR